MKLLRSLLFVPGDRPERFDKAVASGADAIILDLEDSVSLQNKDMARGAIAGWLLTRHPNVPSFVRVNPNSSGMMEADLRAVLNCHPDGIVLPKTEGAASVIWLKSMMKQVCPDAEHPAILPIATETPNGIFEMGSLRDVSSSLLAITWGAEDLPAAIGAASSREEDGHYTPPYELARSLTLFAAHASTVPAIDTVFPFVKDESGLAAYAARAARDGFSGMMAIHPVQVPVINHAFTPTEDQISIAQAIVDAFSRNPIAGVLQVNGKMVDKPHLQQARNILDRILL